MNTKRIFTQRVAMELMRKGHELVRCERNPKNEKLIVFIFNATKEFYLDFNLVDKAS